MTGYQDKSLVLCFEDSMDELFSLESIIKLTQESCMVREEDSIYYNLASHEKIFLSEERNHYINMLTIALDKINKLKKMSSQIEKELSFL